MTEYAPAKTDEYLSDVQFSKDSACCEKYLKDNKHKSFHLARKHARIFARGHYLFREANSFSRVKFEKNCDLPGTDNDQGQISEHLFTPNGSYCVYYPSNIFRSKRNLWKIGHHSDIQNCACCKKHLNDNKHNSLHLVEKYAQIFVPGHYLFLKAHSFPWGTLSENCLLLGTDNVHGQIPVHIFCDKWRLLFI